MLKKIITCANIWDTYGIYSKKDSLEMIEHIFKNMKDDDNSILITIELVEDCQ